MAAYLFVFWASCYEVHLAAGSVLDSPECRLLGD